MIKFQEIAWLEPWLPVSEDSAARAERELQREIIAGHPLFGLAARAVGRRADCDDYLFFLPGNESPLAVVHLTFQIETTAGFPRTIFYRSLAEWLEKDMKSTHTEYTGERAGEF